MAITALGIGTKQAPDNVNLDPQRQFWSWLMAFRNYNDPNYVGTASQCVYFNGFRCRQNDPVGMSILIGGEPETDSAALDLPGGRMVLLSTDGTPETVTIPTAPASGSRIDAIVSYIDTTSADPEAETPGTPEYVHTIVVSGTAASSPSAPTDAQIVAALPAGAGGQFYRWCDVKVAANQTTITNSNITDKKPMSPNVYWTTSEIQDIAKSALQFSASSLTGSAQFGDLLIQWGQHIFNNVPSGNDTTARVDFSRTYAVPPQVVVSCGSWIAIRGVWTYSISTSGFNCGVYQAQGSPQKVLLSWIAIGKAS